MTKCELKIVLKLHHEWKVKCRITYATLLMRYTDGKILSIFESAASEAISFNHLHAIYNYEIDWDAVYAVIVRFMLNLAKEVSDGQI